MKISELISKLEKVKEVHGDLDVLMECSDDVSINSVCYVDEDPYKTHEGHVRLTDDKEAIFEIYEEDPDDTIMVVEEY